MSKHNDDNKLGHSNGTGTSGVMTGNISDDINLFTPIQIRDLSISNRIGVPPMDIYSAIDGYPQDIHFIQYCNYALKGFGFIIFEATAIDPIGRISPNDCGIWDDKFIPSYQKITQWIHSNTDTKIGIQLAHAGRKGSSAGPTKLVRKRCLDDTNGGWDVVGPSTLKYNDDWNNTIQLTTEDVSKIPKLFAECAIRSIKSGFDFIEIHSAHGYLLHEFISPITNNRNDIYGGQLSNRIKLLKEIIIEIRKVIPNNMPLFVRLSCEDFIDGSITINDTINIVNEIKGLGVDLINCSSGGLSPDQKIPTNWDFQLKYPKVIKNLGILTAAVGGIIDTETANNLVKSKEADVVLIGGATLRDVFHPRHAAIDIGVDLPKYFPGIDWSMKIPKHSKY